MFITRDNKLCILKCDEGVRASLCLRQSCTLLSLKQHFLISKFDVFSKSRQLFGKKFGELRFSMSKMTYFGGDCELFRFEMIIINSITRYMTYLVTSFREFL